MILDVVRFSSGKESTLGLLYIDKKFECYTLEDEQRTKKVWGEMRIPAGEYEIGLRTEGGFHNNYSKRFPGIHKGMLQVLNVPEFEYILIHIGNTDDDTAGCLLVGDIANNNQITDGKISSSTDAYVRTYPKILAAIKQDNSVKIKYHDSIL